MIEVVAMVYKSPDFAAFISDQLFDLNSRVVGNDPHPAVQPWLDDVYHDPIPHDHYLSRVYRCWNYCVESSASEYVCLVHTDLAFSPGWLSALENRLDGKTLPVPRLVEPGYTKPNGHVLIPGKHAIHMDIGRNPALFPWDSWRMIAADLSENRTEPGGLFAAPIIHREAFLSVGGFPHGNITVDGKYWSGDAYLFHRMGQIGYRHVTCFDSLVYHMQEGEMRHHE